MGSISKIKIENNVFEIKDEKARNQILENELKTENNFSKVDSRIKSLVSGSPQGVYETTDLLISNNPKTGIYLVLADGHIYSYTKDNSNPIDLGVYQSTQIGENVIRYEHLSHELQMNLLNSNVRTSDYSLIGSYYSGNVGEVVSTTAQATRKGGVLEVDEGDILNVPLLFHMDYASMPLLILTDENDVIIEKYINTDLLDVVTKQSKNFTKLINNNIKKVYFNCSNSTENNRSWYPYILSGYNYADIRLTNYLTEMEEINYSETLNGMYTLANWGLVFGDFITRVYKVNPLEKIKIKTTLFGSDQSCPGIFTDSNDKPISYVLPLCKNDAEETVEVETMVPGGASKLYICIKPSYQTIVSRYKLNGSGAIANSKKNQSKLS